MSDLPFSHLLGTLSDELLLAVDPEGFVRAANPRAGNLLGVEPVGRGWPELLATRSREKGLAFLNSLAELPPDTASEGCELLFHVVGAPPLLVTARGGRLPDGTRLVAARSETGRLSALYYEALAINDDLTMLARRLARENSALAARVTELEQERSLHTMPDNTELAVARALELHREELGAQVSDALAYMLPAVGLKPDLPDRNARHHERMRSTAQRFHEMVQAGVTLDWSLVAFEFGWASGVLPHHGVTGEHLQALIDTYFQAADALPWSDEERVALKAIAARVRELGEETYPAPSTAA